MRQSLHHRVRATVLGSLVLAGCGSSTNLNQIWGGDDSGGDSDLVKAQMAYDRGDFSTADKLTSDLVARNPDNEDAAILQGYVHLSQGGIDPYRLARQLVAMNATATATNSALTADTSSSSSSSNASTTLKALGALINLSTADFATLSQKTFDNNGGTVTLFGSDNPLLVPKTVDDTLRAQVPVLNYMNQATKVICRFVDDSVKPAADTRNADAGCTQTPYPRHASAKAHFLWAFTHLTEALVYQSVLLYTTDGNTAGSNFQAATNKVDTFHATTAAEFTTFVNEVQEMKNATDAVFDTSSDNSMIHATLTDMDEVTLAFSAMSGIPSSVTKQITDAVASINTLGKQIGGAANAANNSKAFKVQMTQKFANTVGSKIDKAADEQIQKITGDKTATYAKNFSDLSADQQATMTTQLNTMCTAYTGLTADTPSDQKSKPKVCG